MTDWTGFSTRTHIKAGDFRHTIINHPWYEFARACRKLPYEISVLIWDPNLYVDKRHVVIEMGPIVIADFEIEFEKVLTEGQSYIEDEITRHIEAYKDKRLEDLDWDTYYDRDPVKEYIWTELRKGLDEAIFKGLTTKQGVRDALGFGTTNDRSGPGGTPDRREERIITGESPIWWCG